MYLEKCLLTVHSLQPTGRYFDPKSKKSFKYDHIKHTASDIRQEQTETHSESRRIAIQDQVQSIYPGYIYTMYHTCINTILI